MIAYLEAGVIAVNVRRLRSGTARAICADTNRCGYVSRSKASTASTTCAWQCDTNGDVAPRQRSRSSRGASFNRRRSPSGMETSNVVTRSVSLKAFERGLPSRVHASDACRCLLERKAGCRGYYRDCMKQARNVLVVACLGHRTEVVEYGSRQQLDEFIR